MASMKVRRKTSVCVVFDVVLEAEKTWDIISVLSGKSSPGRHLNDKCLENIAALRSKMTAQQEVSFVAFQVLQFCLSRRLWEVCGCLTPVAGDV